MKLQKTSKEILGELQSALSGVDEREVSNLARAICRARGIFIVGAGRTRLVLAGFAMRLMHLGLRAFLIGEATTPAIGRKDLLLAASARGASEPVLRAIKKAKTAGAKVALITSRAEPLPREAGIRVRLASNISTSRQFGGSLFEQSLWLFCDSLVVILQKNLKQTHAEMLKRHANIE